MYMKQAYQCMACGAVHTDRAALPTGPFHCGVQMTAIGTSYQELQHDASVGMKAFQGEEPLEKTAQ